MTLPGARTQMCKERVMHMKDRAPHIGVLANTEQQDISHHEMNHAHPEGDDVRATLKRHGGYTVTWADRGENQSMNNQPKYNKGDLT